MFVATAVVSLCLASRGLGGDETKKGGSDLAVAAPMPAVAMPQLAVARSNTTHPAPNDSAPSTVASAIQAVVPSSLASKALSTVRPQTGADFRVTSAILKVAEPQLDRFLEEALPVKETYGFESDDLLSRAVLGEPIPIYTVSEQDAHNYREGNAVEPLLKESGCWLVPVQIGGAFRAFIEVDRTSTNTLVAKTPSAILARVWKVMVNRWPAKENFHPRFVVYPNVPGYFFTVPEVHPQNLTDIVRILSEVDKPTSLSPAAVILRSWR